MPAFVLRTAYERRAPHNTDVSLRTRPSVAREAAALRDTFPKPQDGLQCLQAAGAGRPRDAHLRSKPDEATVEPEPGEGARTDAHEDREPAARAALTFTRKDASGRTAQLPDGRQRLGRDAADAQTRHAPIIGLRRLFR